MGKQYLLDCTLRDGGYVNNWMFGNDTIDSIVSGLCSANVDIIELGFIRDVDVGDNSSVYASRGGIEQRIRRNGKHNTKYCAMLEAKENMDEWYPIGKIGQFRESGMDFIRIMAWEWKLEEHLSYCKAVKEEGMQISIQPTAITDYDDDRFKRLLEMSNEISPYAFYLVDTWGTESPMKIGHFADLADRELDSGIKLGYHGHNNKMQSLACMESLLSMDLSRDLCIDASIGGMGKGPGNLQTEVAADKLNEICGKNHLKYDTDMICGLYRDYVEPFYADDAWGYSVYHFIGSRELVTQNYATYFRKNDYGVDVFYEFVRSLKGREKVVFNAEFTERRLEELGLK